MTQEEKATLEINDLVQLHPGMPSHHKGAILVVKEITSWGGFGFLMQGNKHEASWKMVRFENANAVKVGRAHWIPEAKTS